MYDVLEHGVRTMTFETYEEACEYLDNVFGSDMWFMYDYGIIPHDDKED